MRQQNSDLVELLDAFALDGHWFGRVRLERNGEQKCFQFGVSQAGYLALQRAVQLRPFDQLPGLRHRYFFGGLAHRLSGDEAIMAVRVVQARDQAHVNVEAPTDLVANLKWFAELQDWTEAEALAIADPRL